MEPIIRLSGITRDYPSGDGVLHVLRGVDLTIAQGEFVAIIGASGSGKSTLMNILGCLDTPSGGSYRLDGKEVAKMEAASRAALRREFLGFIFQHYHLLPEMTALGNVEVPAIYRGMSPHARHEKAAALLGRLGMGDRLNHRPGQLSGGQQQRVSIARALVNDARIILADEPTGALDSRSGDEVLAILEELHRRDGRTVIIVTHDAKVAARANRIIEIAEGQVIADSGLVQGRAALVAQPPAASPGIGQLAEAARMAVLAMCAHKLRSFLTMLGIIIGIASVVSVVALGEGSRQQVLQNISGLGTNTLQIFPGENFGDMRSGRVTTLVSEDGVQLARQPFVASVSPTVSTSPTLRYGATEASAQISGVSEQYFDVAGITLTAGRAFDANAVQQMSQDVVIDENTRAALFADEDPLGKTFMAGQVPLRVIGIAKARQNGPGGSTSLTIYAPYTTVQARYLGTTIVSGLTLRVSDDTDMALAQQSVTSFLTQRHGGKDFFIVNNDEIRQTITSTTQTMTLLIAAIAVISLLVGGIGVMNIMLVSVTERITEIGVRMAVGARRSDIRAQFLIEAVLVCIIGGIAGVLFALGSGQVFERFGGDFTLVYSPLSIVAAMASSCGIGLAFGYLPAASASRLDPVAALARG
ncbi:MacB family efflux pump subunit [Paracoccus laeviglucosivorans]|uniref:Pyoverdine export ATP-binding/permease protein PvdT n=1 Tax=Paracoccus laeviglucosivorans TaxID=1197861 RepID=A0A521FAE9_9RHOB|nr:MacB family efflux pump subunit [Paracoccus laeviglucosivorans]SMO93014.1 macrolide transport system ATP-binding/permease protein [Paracoccus laeviglucosivorans]